MHHQSHSSIKTQSSDGCSDMINVLNSAKKQDRATINASMQPKNQLFATLGIVLPVSNERSMSASFLLLIQMWPRTPVCCPMLWICSMWTRWVSLVSAERWSSDYHRSFLSDLADIPTTLIEAFPSDLERCGRCTFANSCLWYQSAWSSRANENCSPNVTWTERARH